MCGRFTLTVETADLQEAFTGFEFPPKIGPRYNIAPSQPVLVLPNDGKNKADFFVWGLIPSWAKDPTIGSRIINARAETLAEKPSFRAYPLQTLPKIRRMDFTNGNNSPARKVKTPHYIRLKNQHPFAFAGLWDEWLGPDGSQIKSCAIITTAPNALIKNIHERMPVIVRPQDYAKWLAPESRQSEELKPLLSAYPAEEMEAYPVKTLVNQAKLDLPEMIKP